MSIVDCSRKWASSRKSRAYTLCNARQNEIAVSWVHCATHRHKKILCLMPAGLVFLSLQSLWLLELVHCLLQCLQQNCFKNIIPEFLNCPTYIFKNTDEIYFSIFHFFFGIVNVPIYWFVSYIPFEFRGRVGSFFSRQSFFIYFCQLFNDFSYFICSLFFWLRACWAVL